MWNYPPHRELIKAQDESNPEVSIPLNYKSWEDQGILVLPVALTLGPNLNSMFNCWDWIMYKIFIALSKKKDLIWMFKTYDGALKLGKYIHKQKVVNDSLEAFITNKESNLVIKHYNNKKAFSLVNAILHNKKEKETCATNRLLQFLAQNLHYPSIARENGIEGAVVISFVVETDGSISGAKVVRDIGGGCGAEALRVVNEMPVWRPGMQRGRAVRVQFNLPVRFRLD